MTDRNLIEIHDKIMRKLAEGSCENCNLYKIYKGPALLDKHCQQCCSEEKKTDDA